MYGWATSNAHEPLCNEQKIDNQYTGSTVHGSQPTRNVWPTNHLHAIDICCTLLSTATVFLPELNRRRKKKQSPTTPFISIWNACFEHPFEINLLPSSSTSTEDAPQHAHYTQRTEGGAMTNQSPIKSQPSFTTTHEQRLTIFSART